MRDFSLGQAKEFLTLSTKHQFKQDSSDKAFLKASYADRVLFIMLVSPLETSNVSLCTPYAVSIIG